MTLNDLKKVTRVLTPVRKNEIIEEHSFAAGAKCYEAFMKTGDIKTLRAGLYAYRTSLQAMRDFSRYHAKIED